MIIKPVKDYIRQTVNGFGYKEWKDAFNFENIPGNMFDNAYHIEVQIPSITLGQQWYENDMAITLRFFKKGGRAVMETLEEVMEDVNCIKIELSKLPLYVDVAQSISATSLVTAPLTSNDNQMIIELSLTCRVIENI